MRLGLMIAFSCAAKQKPSHFFLTKTHLKETLADAQRCGRERRGGGVDGGGGGGGGGGVEECQHLCWGYFLFYSCFL